MVDYVFRRLLLLPLTLFLIILINFVIINLAPGDPTTVSSISPEGAKQDNQSVALSSDDRYLQFREHYGLTLPILFNRWPWLTEEEIDKGLNEILIFRQNQDKSPLSFKQYDQKRILLGDQARFVMGFLINIILNEANPFPLRQLASSFFVRGGTKQANVGSHLTEEQKVENDSIAKENNFLRTHLFLANDSPEVVQKKGEELKNWYQEQKRARMYELSSTEKWKTFFTETRFSRYFTRVLTLDFGTLRNDNNKRVIDEVLKRFPISLTLSVIPLITTFFLCQLFGFLMAWRHNRPTDRMLTLFFLILYAIPVFVAAPFLIEKVALYHTFPFTNTPIPTHGFTSPERIFDQLTSSERLLDVIQHIALPLIAILYGNLAAQSRLTRTLVLEIKQLDFVRTAFAKGLSTWTVAWKHIGRNAAIILITSLAGSLPVVLGGSLIVETLFEINGFGRFFYEGILNRDYNVVMFSALAGSFLTLIGYLVADLCFAALDPRVSFD